MVNRRFMIDIKHLFEEENNFTRMVYRLITAGYYDISPSKYPIANKHKGETRLQLLNRVFKIIYTESEIQKECERLKITDNQKAYKLPEKGFPETQKKFSVSIKELLAKKIIKIQNVQFANRNISIFQPLCFFDENKENLKSFRLFAEHNDNWEKIEKKKILYAKNRVDTLEESELYTKSGSDMEGVLVLSLPIRRLVHTEFFLDYYVLKDGSLSTFERCVYQKEPEFFLSKSPKEKCITLKMERCFQPSFKLSETMTAILVSKLNMKANRISKELRETG